MEEPLLEGCFHGVVVATIASPTRVLESGSSSSPNLTPRADGSAVVRAYSGARRWASLISPLISPGGSSWPNSLPASQLRRAVAEPNLEDHVPDQLGNLACCRPRLGTTEARSSVPDGVEELQAKTGGASTVVPTNTMSREGTN